MPEDDDKIIHKTIVELAPAKLQTSASAARMAEALDKFATQLTQLAVRLRAIKHGEEIFRIKIVISDECNNASIVAIVHDCNGGSDGC
jgi:hypothetical protein